MKENIYSKNGGRIDGYKEDYPVSNRNEGIGKKS